MSYTQYHKTKHACIMTNTHAIAHFRSEIKGIDGTIGIKASSYTPSAMRNLQRPMLRETAFGE